MTKNIFPTGTNPFIVDAYLLIQDIVLLVGADQPKWLIGIVEMTRTFGLELLESLLSKVIRCHKVYLELIVFQFQNYLYYCIDIVFWITECKNVAKLVIPTIYQLT